jgi:hypothetical protein
MSDVGTNAVLLCRDAAVSILSGQRWGQREQGWP